jgi:hypothetical protein
MDGYLSEMDNWKQKEQIEANTLRIAVAIGGHGPAPFCAALRANRIHAKEYSRRYGSLVMVRGCHRSRFYVRHARLGAAVFSR